MSGWGRALTRFAGVAAFMIAAVALAARFVPIVNHVVLGLAVPAPYLMCGALLAAILAVWSRAWKLTAVSLVLTVAVVAVQLPWYRADPRPDGVSVRIVTANVKYSHVPPSDMVRLAEDQADIVMVQELTPGLAEAMSTGLARDFPYRAVRAREGAAGVGLWSRYPITGWTTDEAFTQGFVAAHVQLPSGRPLVAVSAHLMAPWPEPSSDWRGDMARLDKALQQLPGDKPVILGGDLNATPDLREFRALLHNGFHDGAAQAGAGITRTYPADSTVPPLIAIDHVLTRGATVTAMTTLSLPGSDHRALAAAVVLP